MCSPADLLSERGSSDASEPPPRDRRRRRDRDEDDAEQLRKVDVSDAWVDDERDAGARRGGRDDGPAVHQRGTAEPCARSTSSASAVRSAPAGMAGTM